MKTLYKQKNNKEIFIYNYNNTILIRSSFFYVEIKNINKENRIENLLIFIFILIKKYKSMPKIFVNDEHIKNILEYSFSNLCCISYNFPLFYSTSILELKNIIPFKKYTLSFLFDKNRVLLGKKKRGFGINYYNGFGGKVHNNETIEDAAIREVLEESGLKMDTFFFSGKLFFIFENSLNPAIEGNVYYCHRFSGIPEETEEMKPEWFYVPEKITLGNVVELYNKIPFSNMWEDDVFWFPFLINKDIFYGFFILNHNNELLFFQLEITDELIPESNSSS